MTLPATAALINLDSGAIRMLEGCFSQFGIRTLVLTGDIEQRIRREKFDACVLPLNDKAEPILQAVRNSPSNRRIMIYAVAEDSRKFLSLSKYGINILLQSPVDRQAALKAIRATHLLVVHEHRRYVRIPIAVGLQVELEGRTLGGTSREISAGGMSMTVEPLPKINQLLTVIFELPENSQLVLKGSVCWTRETEGLFGVRFAEGEGDRDKVKNWIDAYLGIA